MWPAYARNSATANSAPSPANQSGINFSEPPELATLIEEPSILPYNFTAYHLGDFQSQKAQDKWVDSALGSRSGLFVVESGAYNGEDLSNSLYFETKRHWECLLIEANPALGSTIRHKHRRCYFLPAALSITGSPAYLSFEKGGPLGGLTDTLTSYGQGMLSTHRSQKLSHVDGPAGHGSVLVPTFPLEQIMAHIGRHTVDFWSLDVEGAEHQILTHFNFSQVEVGIMCIEVKGMPVANRQALRHLFSHLKFHCVHVGLDSFVLNPAYYRLRGLKQPQPLPMSTCF